jgi:hypothetical protein
MCCPGPAEVSITYTPDSCAELPLWHEHLPCCMYVPSSATRPVVLSSPSGEFSTVTLQVLCLACDPPRKVWSSRCAFARHGHWTTLGTDVANGHIGEQRRDRGHWARKSREHVVGRPGWGIAECRRSGRENTGESKVRDSRSGGSRMSSRAEEKHRKLRLVVELGRNDLGAGGAETLNVGLKESAVI